MEFIQLVQQNVLYLIFALLLFLMFRTRILAKIYGLQSISAQDAFQLLRKKDIHTLFLDVRTPWELEHEPRIKKSTSIPLAQLSKRMDEIKALGLGRKIVIICRSGNRAKSAGLRLRKAGFSDVYVMGKNKNQLLVEAGADSALDMQIEK